MTKQIMVGSVPVGGGAAVSIQSMCNTKTHDVPATVDQIHRLEAAGCEIVRVAVPDMAAAKAIGAIKSRIHVPLVADIHFDYRLALECAAQGDFALCLYNPASKKRADYLKRACDILLRYKNPETVCGWVQNIGRAGQEYKILNLAQLQGEQLDMFTTVFIGSSTTQNIGGRMVTPRGYRL